MLLMLISVSFYIKIADEMKSSIKGKWAGFFAMFLNYVVSKQFYYYPVLTDQMAFTLGLLLLFFYIRNK